VKAAVPRVAGPLDHDVGALGVGRLHIDTEEAELRDLNPSLRDPDAIGRGPRGEAEVISRGEFAAVGRDDVRLQRGDGQGGRRGDPQLAQVDGIAVGPVDSDLALR
jgi:hypothetical protein